MMYFYELPSILHKNDLLVYRCEVLGTDRNFDGTAGLGNFGTIRDWLDRLHDLTPEHAARYGYYPTLVYLVYKNESLAGIVNIRLSDDDFLRRCAGHIGYHVRPSMRRQGIAHEILLYAAGICRSNGISSPIVCTEPGNIASQKTALSCGFVPDGETVLETGEHVLRFILSEKEK